MYYIVDGNKKSHRQTKCGGFKDQRTSSIADTQDSRPEGSLFHLSPMDRR